MDMFRIIANRLPIVVSRLPRMAIRVVVTIVVTIMAALLVLVAMRIVSQLFGGWAIFVMLTATFLARAISKRYWGDAHGPKWAAGFHAGQHARQRIEPLPAQRNIFDAHMPSVNFLASDVDSLFDRA